MNSLDSPGSVTIVNSSESSENVTIMSSLESLGNVTNMSSLESLGNVTNMSFLESLGNVTKINSSESSSENVPSLPHELALPPTLLMSLVLLFYIPVGVQPMIITMIMLAIIMKEV